MTQDCIINEWAELVSAGTSGAQYGVPDGSFTGDLYFITDHKNAIIVILYWTGSSWIQENSLMSVQPNGKI